MISTCILILGASFAAAAWYSPKALRWAAVRLLARARAVEVSRQVYRTVYAQTFAREEGRIG